MKHIFIIGSKGIPAKYGGFETFVECLSSFKKDEEIQYHVACMGSEKKETVYHGARCFTINVPNIGPAKAIYYDVMALRECLSYIKNENIQTPTIYILACRIGPFLKKFKKQGEKLNTKIYLNPDGQEWKREKWNYFIRKYWKISERYMVKNSDLIICDSQNIEQYIKDEYQRYTPNTCFIPYGANIQTQNQITSPLVNTQYKEWLIKHNLQDKSYYLIVGRFVPENNQHIIIKEFMNSKTNSQLVIITNVQAGKYLNKIRKDTQYPYDTRIQFVGTIYDQEVLNLIRKNAIGYIHGHEVGGTNPSLLEAMASTNVNLLLDVSFNKEVGKEAAFYWNKDIGTLRGLIEYIDGLTEEEVKTIGEKAKNRIQEAYSWDTIIKNYEKVLKE